MNKDKVIYVDWGWAMFRSIFMWEKTRQVPPTYTCMSTIISALKKVGVNDNDTVIVAVDSKEGSWRKNFDNNYKGGRKEAREKHDIDWKKTFAEFDDLKERLKVATNFHFLEWPKVEADDIISVGCRYFKDKDNVIVSPDHDFFELAQFENVKIFSPIKKYKGKKGSYIKVANPFKELSKKIQNEASDGLTSAIVTNADYELRKKLVTLSELPDDVELPLKKLFEDLTPKTEYDTRMIPFKTMQERFPQIYLDKDVIDYQTCIDYKKRVPKKKKVIK